MLVTTAMAVLALLTLCLSMDPDPRVADAQKRAMVTYRRLERFFKRGAFFGLQEGIHAHALPEENAFVVNLFNLSDESRIVEQEHDEDDQHDADRQVDGFTEGLFGQ